MLYSYIQFTKSFPVHAIELLYGSNIITSLEHGLSFIKAAIENTWALIRHIILGFLMLTSQEENGHLCCDISN